MRDTGATAIQNWKRTKLARTEGWMEGGCNEMRCLGTFRFCVENTMLSRTGRFKTLGSTKTLPSRSQLSRLLPPTRTAVGHSEVTDLQRESSWCSAGHRQNTRVCTSLFTEARPTNQRSWHEYPFIPQERTLRRHMRPGTRNAFGAGPWGNVCYLDRVWKWHELSKRVGKGQSSKLTSAGEPERPWLQFEASVPTWL